MHRVDVAEVILVDQRDVALALTEAFSFEVAPGERVSIHPLAPITFWRSEGLEYPLDSVTLAPGVRTGTSNKALTGPFSIVPEELPAVKTHLRARLEAHA